MKAMERVRLSLAGHEAAAAAAAAAAERLLDERCAPGGWQAAVALGTNELLRVAMSMERLTHRLRLRRAPVRSPGLR